MRVVEAHSHRRNVQKSVIDPNNVRAGQETVVVRLCGRLYQQIKRKRGYVLAMV